MQIFRSENFVSKKFHIVRNIRFFSPDGSLKFIKFSRQFAIQQLFKLNSLRAFSVQVFVILKFLFLLVSFVCTSGSSMPLFSSFKAFKTSNRSLCWINIGNLNMFNSRSCLLYSASLFPVIYLTNFFWNFSRFWISVLPAVKHVKPYSNTGKIKDLCNPNFTNVFTLVATFLLSMYRTLFAFFILSSICCFHDTSAATWIPRSLTVDDFAKSFPISFYCWSLPLKFRNAHLSIASSVFFGLSSSQSHVDHLGLPSSFFVKPKF